MIRTLFLPVLALLLCSGCVMADLETEPPYEEPAWSNDDHEDALHYFAERTAALTAQHEEFVDELDEAGRRLIEAEEDLAAEHLRATALATIIADIASSEDPSDTAGSARIQPLAEELSTTLEYIVSLQVRIAEFRDELIGIGDRNTAFVVAFEMLKELGLEVDDFVALEAAIMVLEVELGVLLSSDGVSSLRNDRVSWASDRESFVSSLANEDDRARVGGFYADLVPLGNGAEEENE